ncbi:hypothetical protein B566_EDAN007067 [Ephemera danica]|nr:hypothetical protein B566_EDAN007067 [Ephemera danica]
MAELQPPAPTSIHEADRKLSCIPPPHATATERKVSTASSLHERKVSTATSGLQGLQISSDNILLREARSASVSTGNGPNSPTLHHHNPHVPKKFIHTWRQACDKTKERTKDLIKRWRTLPEGSPTSTPPDGEARGGSWGHSWGWGISGDDPSSGDGMTATDGSMESGEAWWRCRGFPGQPPPPLLPLAQEQRAKLAQLFNTLLDTDSDGLVAPDDFHGLAERLCQFAGWKEHGPQACMLRENGDHNLNCPTYQLVFANFLLGRHPNGPGQYVFGPFGDSGRHMDDTIFPVDYSAMNSLPEDLEEYSPGRRSNRRSVIV